jgi:hypothetical protein
MLFFNIVKTVQAGSNGGDEATLKNPVLKNILGNIDVTDGSVFATIIVSLWRSVISIGALVVLVFYIIAAFEWITSGGDSQGVEKARNRFLNATIGLVLLASSFAIITFVGELIFGSDFDILTITIPAEMIPEE